MNLEQNNEKETKIEECKKTEIEDHESEEEKRKKRNDPMQ